jgi:hypothetical protein
VDMILEVRDVSDVQLGQDVKESFTIRSSRTQGSMVTIVLLIVSHFFLLHHYRLMLMAVAPLI